MRRFRNRTITVREELAREGRRTVTYTSTAVCVLPKLPRRLARSFGRGTHMALYIVTAVQFDATGEVQYVRWRGDNSHGLVAVAGVVEAIDRGDIVEMWFRAPTRSSIRGQADQEASTQRQDDDSGSNRYPRPDAVPAAENLTDPTRHTKKKPATCGGPEGATSRRVS